MKQTKNFLCKYINGDFWGFVLFISVMAVYSAVFQGLLIWIGGLFPSAKGLGLALDLLLGLVLVLPLFLGAGLDKHKGNESIIIALLAIIGIYVCIIFWFNWLLLIGCIIVLYFNLRRLDKIGGNTLWIYSGGCAYLLYCIGTYFALIFNGIQPAADIYAIAILSIITFYIGVKPAFK